MLLSSQFPATMTAPTCASGLAGCSTASKPPPTTRASPLTFLPTVSLPSVLRIAISTPKAGPLEPAVPKLPKPSMSLPTVITPIELARIDARLPEPVNIESVTASVSIVPPRIAPGSNAPTPDPMLPIVIAPIAGPEIRPA